jgi:hypothetical protein
LLDAAADEIVRLPRAVNGYQEAAQKLCDVASGYASTLGSGEDVARFYDELLARLKGGE